MRVEKLDLVEDERKERVYRMLDVLRENVKHAKNVSSCNFSTEEEIFGGQSITLRISFSGGSPKSNA